MAINRFSWGRSNREKNYPRFHEVLYTGCGDGSVPRSVVGSVKGLGCVCVCFYIYTYIYYIYFLYYIFYDLYLYILYIYICVIYIL